MLSDGFALRLLVSFTVGFVVVAAVTTLADYAGEGPAGLVGGMPWTGPTALLAIGYTQSARAAASALTLFPLGTSATAAFLLFYAFPTRLKFRGRMVFALGLWSLASIGIALWAPRAFALSVAVSLTVFMAVLYLRSKITINRVESLVVAPSLRRTVLRGALGGSVVAAVVIIGMVGGPIVGGVFAAAPAVWSSSLFVTSRSQGLAFSRSITWTFMKTGALTAIPYAVSASIYFSVAGIWLGTLLAYITISPLAYLAWRLARR